MQFENRIVAHTATLLFIAAAIGTFAASPAAIAAKTIADNVSNTAQSLSDQFGNPGPEFRGKPFWSWNGELHEDELLRQIDVLQKMGMGGYFMHSRTGLATEYLGEDWFKLINRCADQGAGLGLEAWLYDEDRWPSGTAGGLVTAEPKFRQKFISMRTIKPEEFSWKDDIVATFACKLDGTNYSDCERLNPASKLDSLAEKTILIFTVEPAAPSSFFNGNTDVDRLSREATEYFIQLTHEKYREKCGDRLGKAIPGIFTDEPHRGAAFCGFSLQNDNSARMTPWTEKLPEEYQKRFGDDIIDRLPELFLKKDGNAVALVKWRYMELLESMFLENWCKPVREWCDKNGMIFSGHFLHEDSLSCQTAVQGSLMRSYEYQHSPGVDVLTEGNRNYWIVKQLSSVARQMGQKQLLSELYGCTGWQMNFESHKAVGDWQALFGINLRCPHLSWYTMAGEAKRDYPASIFFQSGWWRDYHFVEDYYSRLNMLLAQGRPECDVLVLNPIESVWCQVGVGWAKGLSGNTKEINDLEDAYKDIFAWLAGSQIDFDYGDEEMFGRLCKVAKSGDVPVLRFSQAEYRAAIVPKMTTIRSTSVKLLDEFRAAGGKVIFVGEPPAFVDVTPSNAASDLAKQTTSVAWDKTALIAAVKDAPSIPVEIVDENGAAIDDIFCQLRECNDMKILVAINTSVDQWLKNTTVRVKTEGSISEWNCLTGERFAAPSSFNSGWTETITDFPPSGEHAYIITKQSIPGLLPLPQYKEKTRQVCNGPFTYSLNEPNVCVLDMASCKIDGKEIADEMEILKIDRKVRENFGLPARGGEMVQPWYSKKFEPKPEPKGEVSISFTFNIETPPQGEVRLGVEEPSNYKITINGKEIPSTPNGWWVDPAIQAISIPAKLFVPGENRVELTTNFRKDMNLEALYLLGQFGVKLDGTKKTLTRLPEKLTVGDLTAQGLPFYSGSVTYRIPVANKPGEGQKAFLETPKFEAACVKVGKDKIIPWQPYEVEVTDETLKNDYIETTTVLTRRNSFGPLHQVPLRSGGYGPGNWTTDGKDWSQSYQLYPAGLLEPPAFSYRADALAEK
jgi:hypothetical protein